MGLVALLAIVLAVLHHDFWFWEDTTLLLGFMPIGLAYHSLFCLLAAGLWAFAVFCAWPSELGEVVEEETEDAS